MTQHLELLNKIYLVNVSVVIISIGLNAYFIFLEIEKFKIEIFRCTNFNKNVLLNDCDLHGADLLDANIIGTKLTAANIITRPIGTLPFLNKSRELKMINHLRTKNLQLSKP